MNFQGEGENAGKALLSRIRMGLHLGEGYAYHVEGVLARNRTVNKYQQPTTETFADDALILMTTMERLLLVKGELGARFCEVIWETPLLNIVNIELFHLVEDSRDRLVFWYMESTETELDHDEDKASLALKADVFGLDILKSKTVKVFIFMWVQTARLKRQKIVR